MIDPRKVTNFNRTDAELQEYLLFCVAVAGKTAVVQARAIHHLVRWLSLTDSLPLVAIKRLWEKGEGDLVETAMKEFKLGKYNILVPLFKELAQSGLDLRTCTLEQLEDFRGIGMKTSRYFALHSRPAQDIAVLDRHMIRYGREVLGLWDSTKPPASRTEYLEKERLLLRHLRNAKLSPAEFDLYVWNELARTNISQHLTCYECGITGGVEAGKILPPNWGWVQRTDHHSDTLGHTGPFYACPLCKED